MGEKRQGATYFTFKGGLNTEASPLNAPPEDARDLVNVDITTAGTVRRRKGIDLLPRLAEPNLFVTEPADYTAAKGTFVDAAPSGISTTITKTDGSSFRVWVAQVGRSIYIYDQDTFALLTDMKQYRQRIPIPALATARCIHYKTKFIKDKNRIYLLNPYMPLAYLVYEGAQDKFLYVTEYPLVRDLDIVKNDSRVSNNGQVYRACRLHNASPDTEPGVGGDWKSVWVHEGKEPSMDAPDAWEHFVPDGGGTVAILKTTEISYDPDTGQSSTVDIYTGFKCILSHTSSEENKPPNSTYWELFEVNYYEGDTSGSTRSPFDYKVVNWLDEQYHNSLVTAENIWAAGKSYIASGSPKVYHSSVRAEHFYDSSNAPRGFNCGVLAGGRLWLGNPTGFPNKLYFSQSIIEPLHYTRFYQWADPKNPNDPDVVETDGGTILLVNAEEIVGLADYRGGVLVLATNGIWYISGADGYFKATTYSIQKISDEGCLGRSSWTSAEDAIVYAGISGIFAVQLDPVGNLPVVAPISDKIKTFWTSIPRCNREAAEMLYNSDEFTLVIGMNFATPDWWATRNPFNQPTRMRDFLLYDIRLRAWYKYSMEEDVNGDKLSPGGLSNILVNLDSDTPVTVSGELVLAEGDTVEIATTTIPKQSIIGIIHIKQHGDNRTRWSLGQLRGQAFQDYSVVPSATEDYVGFIQSVPQPYSDIGHRKQVAYLHTVFERTESGYNSVLGEFENPSGCYYRILWDFASEAADNPKYGTPYQAYKPSKFNTLRYDGTLKGFDVVRNKHRIRGSGRVVSFRFETDSNKDFHLLGWQADLYATESV